MQSFGPEVEPMTQQLFSPLSEFTLEALVAREQWAAAQSSTHRKQPTKVSRPAQQKQAVDKQGTNSQE